MPSIPGTYGRCKDRDDGENQHCLHYMPEAEDPDDWVCCWCGDVFGVWLDGPPHSHGEFAPDPMKDPNLMNRLVRAFGAAVEVAIEENRKLKTQKRSKNKGVRK